MNNTALATPSTPSGLIEGVTRVWFGREAGEKTLGLVLKVNPKSIKVRTLESRGTGRGNAPGSIWKVSPRLVTIATGDDATRVIALPAKTPDALNPEVEAVFAAVRAMVAQGKSAEAAKALRDLAADLDD